MRTRKQLTALIIYFLKEQIHNKLLLILSIIAFVPLFFAMICAPVMLGSYEKVIIDGCIHVPSLFTIFFIFLSIIPYFSRQHTYQTFIFTLPILETPSLWFHAAIIASALILALCFAFFFMLHGTVILFLTHISMFFCLPLYLLSLLESIFLTTLAVLISFICNYQLSIVLMLFFYFVAYHNHILLALFKNSYSGIISQFGTFIMHLVPNLTLLDIKSSVIYQLPISYKPLIAAMLYIFCWICILIIIGHKQSTYFFRNRT